MQNRLKIITAAFAVAAIAAPTALAGGADSGRDPRGLWGRDSCRASFVWRLAGGNDLACVAPHPRPATPRGTGHRE